MSIEERYSQLRKAFVGSVLSKETLTEELQKLNYIEINNKDSYSGNMSNEDISILRKIEKAVSKSFNEEDIRLYKVTDKYKSEKLEINIFFDKERIAFYLLHNINDYKTVGCFFNFIKGLPYNILIKNLTSTFNTIEKFQKYFSKKLFNKCQLITFNDKSIDETIDDINKCYNIILSFLYRDDEKDKDLRTLNPLNKH